MIILILDEDPTICAQYHCNRHCVNMISSYAKFLSTAFKIKGAFNENDRILYPKCWENNPYTQWATLSWGNTYWLYQLYSALLEEYFYRFGNKGKLLRAQAIRRYLSDYFMDNPNRRKLGHTPFPLSLGVKEQYKLEIKNGKEKIGLPITSFRSLYNNELGKKAVWTNRPRPFWYIV